MRGLILLITVIVAVKSTPKTYTNKEALIEDLKLHCDSLCSTYDGVFEFIEKHKSCICYVGKFFDDTDIALMRKNAQSMGMTLKTIKSTPKILSKRDTSEQDHIPTTEPSKKKLLFPEKKPFLINNPKSPSKFSLKPPKFGKINPPQNDDTIVGARANPVAINSRSSARQSSFQPLQPSAMKDIWLKARQRLDHLIKHSDGGKFNSRFAASETQSIRNALKPLTFRTKPSNGSVRNSGLANGKHGVSRNSQGLKVAGNIKPTGTFKPLQPMKTNLSPLSGKSQNKINLFGKHTNGQIKPRMNSHKLVGASGPSDLADGIPNDTTSTTTELNASKLDVDKVTEASLKGPGKKDKKVKKPVNIIVQPPNTIRGEDDEPED